MLRPVPASGAGTGLFNPRNGDVKSGTGGIVHVRTGAKQC